MELRHVQYFVTVAEELSFTRAAARLSMAQSPISQQIRKLERELGVELFARTTRSVVLTAAGRAFYEEAVPLLAATSRMTNNARLAGEGRLGRLSLAFTGTATYELMPQLIRAYVRRYPDVLLDVRSEMFTPAQVEALLDGSVSVGVLRPPASHEGIVTELLHDEPLVALLPVSHPLARRVSIQLSDLAHEPFISYPSSPATSVFQTVTAACRQAGFTPSVRQEAKETPSLVALVAAGMGVALAPASIRHLRINGVTHRPVTGTSVTMPLALAYRAGSVPSIVRGYLETCRAVVRKQKPVSPGPSFRDDELYLPDSV